MKNRTTATRSVVQLRKQYSFLTQITLLAEVEGKKPTQRLMVVINYLEDDDLTQKEAAERYGYTGGWLSQWLERLVGVISETFEPFPEQLREHP